MPDNPPDNPRYRFGRTVIYPVARRMPLRIRLAVYALMHRMGMTNA